MKSMAKGLVALMFGTLLWVNGGVFKEASAEAWGDGVCRAGWYVDDRLGCVSPDGYCNYYPNGASNPECSRASNSSDTPNSGFNTTPASRQKPSSYGVFVYNKKKNVVEGSSKKGSNNEAVRAAYSKALCDADGDCEVVSTYQNQCAALAWGTGFFESRWGKTETAAKKSVLSACGQKAKNCRILISDCSLP